MMNGYDIKNRNGKQYGYDSIQCWYIYRCKLENGNGNLLLFLILSLYDNSNIKRKNNMFSFFLMVTTEVSK